MLKKLSLWCLIFMLILPLPAWGSMADDIQAFEAKYPEIYGTIDQALIDKMESFLEDVVVYVVDNYTEDSSINVQVKNAVASVLLTGDKYENDLLPFMLEQAANREKYEAQLREMSAIVSKEALARIADSETGNGGTGGGGSGGGAGGGTGTTPEPGGTVPPNTEPTTPTQTADPFEDLPATHWATGDIEKLVELGLMTGVSQTEFAPDRNITRAEFSTLLLRVLGVATDNSQTSGRYSDVPADAWYYNIVNAAADLGLVNGYEDQTFGPNDPITREQMAVMICRALAYRGSTGTEDQGGGISLENFSDSQQMSSWALADITSVLRQGIMNGRSATEFAPLENATRAEAAVMILRMLDFIKV